ncbi:Acg family FMN-binding oxidoreductase [Streptomyces sp. NPDC091292]|uniref:Acg family FMN-binding oxidoreductase n=1 Tax=Streptomyces sp. NPDC091292 TaxID=3365991 RepID=UPI003828BCDF
MTQGIDRETTDLPVASLVEDATLAPSLHNAQPWTFRYDPADRTFQIRADPSRQLPAMDPDRRALHLSCAAAVLNLRVAAAHAGWTPATRLLPNPADQDLLAEVTLTAPVSGYDELADLYPALHRRHTSRFPFSAEPIEESLLGVLRRAALLEGARLVYPDAFHTQTIVDLSRDAARREAEDAGLREELAHWTTGGRARDDGIPRYAFGPRESAGGAPVRDFDGGQDTGTLPLRESVVFEDAPRLALLGTTGDTPLDWLRAGQAMERVLLEATLDGLATSVASQALEWSELRWAVRDPTSPMGHVHMVIRLGYGPAGPATRRRPVSDVLSINT